MDKKRRIEVQPATIEELPDLIRMNYHLMEDEDYDRPPDEEELKRRWNDFITLDKFGVYLFKRQSEVVGYTVVHLDTTPFYVRHFFISRDHRRGGWGTASFHALLVYLKTDTLSLEVMAWNSRGREFWKSLGFRERSLELEYRRAGEEISR